MVIERLKRKDRLQLRDILESLKCASLEMRNISLEEEETRTLFLITTKHVSCIKLASVRFDVRILWLYDGKGKECCSCLEFKIQAFNSDDFLERIRLWSGNVGWVLETRHVYTDKDGQMLKITVHRHDIND